MLGEFSGCVEGSTGVNWRNGTVVAGLLLVLLAACSTDDTYLPGLLADPMAHLELEGLKLAGGTESPEGTRIFGKSDARVTRQYELLEGFDGDQLVLETVAAAESAGWVFDDEQPSPFGSWHGGKTLEAGRARISVAISQSSGRLRIILDYEVVFD